MKYLGQRILNQNGSAMLMMIAALTLAAGSALVMMNKSKEEAKVKQGSKIKQSLEHFASEIKMHLTHYDTCTTNLFNKKIGDSPKDPMTSNGIEFLKVNKIYKRIEGEIKVVSVKIKNIYNKNLGANADHISVEFKLDPNNYKNMIQTRDITKNYLIKNHKDAAGVILGCYHEDSNLVETISSQNCSMFNGSITANGFECDENLYPFIDTSNINCGNQKMKISIVDGKIKMSCEA